MVGQRRALRRRGQVAQDFFNEAKQVIDLLELAPRVLVEPALTGQYVQLLEQVNRLARPQHLLQSGIGLGRCVLAHACGPHSNAFQPAGPSARRVARLRSKIVCACAKSATARATASSLSKWKMGYGARLV